jgi:hypothetical protein
MYINITKMADTIVDGCNIDTSVFSYSAPKANPSGGTVINLYNKNFKSSLTVSVPLILTWGAQEVLDQQKNPTGKYSLSLQLPTPEYSNPDLEGFRTSMENLVEKVKQDALTNSKEWFGKKLSSLEVVSEKFYPMLRHPNLPGTKEPDQSKAPTMTVKLPCWNGVWQCEIYDEEGNPLFSKKNGNIDSPINYLKKGSHIACIIQCGGIWIVGNNASITWNLKQAVVKKPKESIEGTCFIKLKESDKQLLKSTEVPDDIPPGAAPSSHELNSAIVEDSDTEEEPVIVTKKKEPEPEPVEEEKKTVVKKIVKKKVSA